MVPDTERVAREQIDRMLAASDWAVQDKHALNPSASQGVAVREYGTDAGPADYVLFVDRVPVGVVELEATVDAELVRSTRLRQAVLKRAFEGRLG